MIDECIAILGNGLDCKYFYFVKFTCEREKHMKQVVKVCEELGQKYLFDFKVIKSMEV